MRAQTRLDSADVQHHQDISEGYLVSRQMLRGRGPRLTEDQWAHLPDLMERLHFVAVMKSALALLRCRHCDGGVSCSLFGKWSALSFREAETTQGPREVVRRWKIDPGLLARPGEASYGTLLLGAAVEEERDGQVTWRLWAQVQGYPSRFLAPPTLARGHWLRALFDKLRSFIGRVYAAYHNIVTFRYLRRLAARLQRGAVE